MLDCLRFESVYGITRLHTTSGEAPFKNKIKILLQQSVLLCAATQSAISKYWVLAKHR